MFPVRVQKSGAAYNKPDVLADNGSQGDPFLPPYDDDLFVEWGFSVGPAHAPQSKHVILLNKFNVLPNHILIVTTDFQPQTEQLNEKDFEVLWMCLRNVNGFGFYNCGANAGPSQPHKHIQFVPLPLEDDETELPFLKLMDNYETLDERAGRDKERSFLISGLQYKHAYSPLPKHLDDHPDQVGQRLVELYRELLTQVQLNHGSKSDSLNEHHNMLLSTRWMLVVPRTREGMEGLSGNGLVFAGIFFVKDQQRFYRLAAIGPGQFLQQLTA